MHTTQLRYGWYAQHNGDFSGDVTFVNPIEQVSYTLPFAFIEDLMAEKIRSDRITSLESATTQELLYG